MKALFTLALLGILYAIGLDRVYLLLDTADVALKGAYRHAVAESERRCVTRMQSPKRTTRKADPDGC